MTKPTFLLQMAVQFTLQMKVNVFNAVFVVVPLKFQKVEFIALPQLHRILNQKIELKDVRFLFVKKLVAEKIQFQ